MRLADQVANWLAANTSGRVYAVCGGAAMFLNDAICHHPLLKVTAMHHEQAAAFAAEADYRVTGRISTVLTTAGPGGTNAITGIASAFVDSIPMLVISGQVDSRTLHADGQRQRGMNELDLPAILRPITKVACRKIDPSRIVSFLDLLLADATFDRPGPVYLEIPLDVQNAQVLQGPIGVASKPNHNEINSVYVDKCVAAIKESSRPLLFIGNGIRLSGAVEECRNLVNLLRIPVVSSWTASDIIPTYHKFIIGRPGLFGDRAGNFAIQNADLILAIGTRLSIPQTGHNLELFAPKAKKIIVDIDDVEIRNKQFPVDLGIMADAKVFIEALVSHGWRSGDDQWLTRCQGWKERYPVILPEYDGQTNGVNCYSVINELPKHMTSDAIVVTDVGASFIPAMQALSLTKDQRLFHSCGVSAMGYGLPAAIGAAIATGGKRQIICLTGDGGLMMNLQELETIAHHQLPISILVFCNNGYMTMQIAQRNHFGRDSISSPDSGLSVPNFEDVASAFGIPAWSVSTNREMKEWMHFVATRRHPILCQLYMDQTKPQPIIPRVQSKMENGKFVPTPIEDMYPYLSREELWENMRESQVETIA